MRLIKNSNNTNIQPHGSACGSGHVCPDATTSECNQTPNYHGQAAKWTTTVQITMGGNVKVKPTTL